MIRYLAACVVLLAALAGEGTARAADAPVNNPALKSDVAGAFREIGGDIGPLISCRGCPGGALPVEADSRDWEKTLNSLPVKTFGGAAYDAYSNIYEAVRDYGFFAAYYSAAYTEGGTPGGTNEFALARSELALARKYADHVAVALDLGDYP